MTYNLLDEKWIPIRRRSGREESIAPHQIAETDDPPIVLASPRPDFDGALIQFLIGLVQTAFAPEDRSEWRERYETPPSPDELRAAFGRYRDAFHLDGDGPRFMQDLTLRPEEAEEKPIADLLVETPKEQTLEQNADLFVKRDGVAALSPAAAAMALMTLQSGAPGGGRGHMTSLRGGGPATSVLVGPTLWHTAWSNTLLRDELTRGGNPDLDAPGAIFPWLAPTRTSDRKQLTSPEHIHPLQQFWAMPRRIRLDFATVRMGTCALTGETGAPSLVRLHAKSYGASYKGAFQHPLTPYVLMKDDEPPNPKKLGADGIPYRDWPAFVSGTERERPALVVQAFLDEGREETTGPVRLWISGYDMENAKAVGFHSALSPVLTATRDREQFARLAARCVGGAREVRLKLLQAVRSALARRSEDYSLDKGILASTDRRFWSDTEPAFFATLDGVRKALDEDGGEAAITSVLETWIRALHAAAMRLFEQVSQADGEPGALDVKRVARAWNDLHRSTSPNAPKLREAVGLAAPEPTTKRPPRRKS